MKNQDLRWWRFEGEELHHSLLRTVRQVHEADGERRRILERSARLYGPGLSGTRGASEEGRYGAISMNAIRAAAQTATNKALENAPPRPWFLTDGGRWEVQRRARGMTRLCEAVMARCGLDDQERLDLLTSSVLGVAITKILERDGQVCLERVMPWELLVDRRDAFDGKPSSIYQIAWIDRGELLSRYGLDGDDDEDMEEDRGELRRAIEEAGDAGLDDSAADVDTTLDEVCVIEAWHRGEGGRHVIATDKGILFEEPWEEPTFPFARLPWGPAPTGYWPPGIGEEVWTVQYEINLVLERIRQMLHMVAVPRVWLEEGSAVSPAALTTEIGARHYYRGQKPIIESARAVSPELWQYIEYLWGKLFSLLGISELAVSALKPAGLDSGKALRTYADLTSGRMRGWALARLRYRTEIAEQIVALLRRLSKKRGEETYLDARSKRLRRVRWEDVALEEGTYQIQCYPVSSLPDTPAARIQMLDEWLNAGLIDAVQYRRLLDAPDLEAETKLLTAARDAFEAVVDAVLYGSDEEAEAARHPSKYDDLALWLRLGPPHLLQAIDAGVPLERVQAFEDRLVEAQAMLEEMQAAAAAQQAAAMAPPPAPPPDAAAMAAAGPAPMAA